MYLFLTVLKNILFICHELFNGAFSEMEYSLVIVLIKFPLNATDAFNGNHKA